MVSVTKIAAMLVQSSENSPVFRRHGPPPGLAAASLARDPRDYRPTPRPANRPDWLQMLDGGTAHEHT